MRLFLAAIGFLVLSGLACAQAPMEATTAAGEKVRLFPDGRWEYADERKASVQRKAVETESARERSAQGGFLGFGRRIYEGDKDYNRGSLNPKLR
jgi:hypothetical protein